MACFEPIGHVSSDGSPEAGAGMDDGSRRDEWDHDDGVEPMKNALEPRLEGRETLLPQLCMQRPQIEEGPCARVGGSQERSSSERELAHRIVGSALEALVR